MARVSRPVGDAAVREYLLTAAEEFRASMCSMLGRDGAESALYAWDECGKTVAALESGQAVRIHRWELPPGHPAHAVGKISDTLVLGADDVLSEPRAGPEVGRTQFAATYTRGQELGAPTISEAKRDRSACIGQYQPLLSSGA